jgi:hypothetical protein
LRLRLHACLIKGFFGAVVMLWGFFELFDGYCYILNIMFDITTCSRQQVVFRIDKLAKALAMMGSGSEVSIVFGDCFLFSYGQCIDCDGTRMSESTSTRSQGTVRMMNTDRGCGTSDIVEYVDRPLWTWYHPTQLPLPDNSDNINACNAYPKRQYVCDSTLFVALTCAC